MWRLVAAVALLSFLQIDCLDRAVLAAEAQVKECRLSLDTASGYRLEVVLTDANLIAKLVTQPLVSAKKDESTPQGAPIGLLDLTMEDGSREPIRLFSPIGRIERRGEKLVADLEALRNWFHGATGVTQELIDRGPFVVTTLLHGRDGPAPAIAFTPDGKTLITLTAGDATRLWDTKTWRLKARFLRSTNPSLEVAVSPDGRFLAFRDRGVSPDGNIKPFDDIPASDVGTPIDLVRIIDLVGQRIQATHVYEKSSDGLCLAFSPDGNVLASGGQGRVELLNVMTGNVDSTLSVKGYVVRLTFMPDGKSIALGDHRGAMTLMDSVTGEVRSRFLGPERRFESLATSPGGEFLTEVRDNEVTVREIRTGREVVTDKEGFGSAFARRSRIASFTPDGRALVSASMELNLRLLELPGGRLTSTLDLVTVGRHKDSPQRLLLAPDCRTLAASLPDGAVIAWDISRLFDSKR